jgi:protein-disulfide isomerase
MNPFGLSGTPLRLGTLSLLGVALACGSPPVAKSTAPAQKPQPSATPAAPAEAQVSPDEGAKVPVLADDLIWGAPTATVTVVAFLDLQCPFCARVQPTLERLKERYGETLRIVIKHNPLPFHNRAYEAALAAATVRALAGNAAGLTFVGKVLNGQKELTSESLETWAAESGLAPIVYRDMMESRRFARKVDDDIALAKELGASGTPAFRVNGLVISGAQPVDAFVRLIDEQRLEAEKLVASGTPQKDVYVTLTGRNFEAVPSLETEKPAEDLTPFRIPVFPDDPQLGPADAKVTLVVFSDFECPFCMRAENTLKTVRERYGSELRIVWKDVPLPFHKQATRAALLGQLVFRKAGNQAFWDLHDTLFANQDTLAETIVEQAAKYHVPLSQLERTERTKRPSAAAAKLDATADLAMDFNVRGTPAFFVNGVRISGAQPVATFVERIDAAVKDADAMLAKGVAPAQLYERLLENAKTPEPLERKDVALPELPRPSKGPKGAKITIQVFSDFQCPFCRRLEPTLTQIAKEYPTDLRIIWRHFPLSFHENAQLAAEAAEAAFAQRGSSGFWAFHERLFAAQTEPEGLDRKNLEKIAAALGLDLPRFRRELDAGTHRGTVDADRNAAERAGINGTPAATINGYFISGAQPASAFRRVIKRILSETQPRPGAPKGTRPDGNPSAPAGTVAPGAAPALR